MSDLHARKHLDTRAFARPALLRSSRMHSDGALRSVVAQYYPGGLNRSNCCHQSICSQCFLQVSPRAIKSAACPFCKASGFATTFKGPMAVAERERLQAEEQRVIEMQIETRVRALAPPPSHSRCSCASAISSVRPRALHPPPPACMQSASNAMVR